MMSSERNLTERFYSQNMLVIAPHCQMFIKDQLSLISQCFKSTTVLLPKPLTAAIALKMPFVNEWYPYLRLNKNSLESLPKDYSIVPSPFLTLPIEVLRRRNFYLSSKSCEKTIRKHKIDFNLIHTHFLENGFIAARLKAIYNTPFVVTAHGVDVYDLPFRNVWYYNLVKSVLLMADQIITVSRYNEKRLRDLGVPSRKLHVIPNGYNSRMFKPLNCLTARKTLGLPTDKKILLSVGNLVTVKGHIYLIDAMSRVLKDEKNVILLIIGSGPLREKLQSQIYKRGLNNNIKILGRKIHEEMPIWLNASDIFVLPSQNEGFPTVVSEAMACGKPVVGTKVGGIPEAVSNDKVGILCEPQNPKSIADAIIFAINKNWIAKEISDYAKQYSWDTLGHQIFRVYSLC
jgi:teichuronic acid biosynthesis glycosyltransferase TuaC